MHSNPALGEKAPLRSPFPRISIGKSNNLSLRHSGHRNTHHEDSIIGASSLINTENKNNHNQSNNQSFDDNFKFPDFYEIDFIEQEAKDDIMHSLHPGNININTDNKVNVNELIELMKENSIESLDHLKDFIIIRQLYQHRDEVFLGKIKNEMFCFVKCFRITNEQELYEAVHEMRIFFILKKQSLELFPNRDLISNCICYYHDAPRSYFYVLYEYFQDSLSYEIFEIDSGKHSESEIMTRKMQIINNLLHLLILLHSNGIIFRDLRFEYFTYDQLTKLPKIFDFANAYMLPKNAMSQHYDPTNTNLFKQIKEEMEYKKLFFTPRFIAPEIHSENPKIGPYIDIFAFGCLLIELLIDYSKFSEEQINPLLTRIFQGNQFNNKEIDKYGDITIYDAIPRIPKTIDKSFAKLIIKCVEANYIERPLLIYVIDKFNILCNENTMEQIVLNKETKDKLEKSYKIYKDIYRLYKEEEDDESLLSANEVDTNSKNLFELRKIWYECKEPSHEEYMMDIYCETCNEVVCPLCKEEKHKTHKCETLGGITQNTSESSEKKMELYSNNELAINKQSVDLFNIKNALREYQFAIQKIDLDENFKVVEAFCENFNNDYISEKERIRESYQSIRNKIKELQEMQLKNLEDSRSNFLDSKFKKIFNESKKIGNLCNIFYQTKSDFLSHYNRFNASFKTKEINTDNFILFKKKWEKFIECTNDLKENATKLREKCEGLRIPGKYIFRKELYTEEILKMLKNTETKIFTEKHKFFDYSKNTSLFLTEELLMIIPLTNIIFSYSKNSYKKFKVDFEKNKIKIHSFLPGCATLHQDEFFYITGGEIKDEATSSFSYMKIKEKVIEESVEMNFTRRFHSMMSLITEHKKYICVIGGWDSKEVEMIETTDGIFGKWLILPSMHYSRSDPTTFLCNTKYIYVFGGWDYNLKRSISEIERYEVFNDEGIKLTKQWEVIKIKGNRSLLEKYNMGLIDISKDNDEGNKEILLVGGYDESYDYSTDVVRIEIKKMENHVNVYKEEEGLPPGGESSFWYEKHFHYLKNDLDKEDIAVNFNCFNNIYVYNFKTKTFRQFANPNTKL